MCSGSAINVVWCNVCNVVVVVVVVAAAAAAVVVVVVISVMYCN